MMTTENDADRAAAAAAASVTTHDEPSTLDIVCEVKGQRPQAQTQNGLFYAVIRRTRSRTKSTRSSRRMFSASHVVMFHCRPTRRHVYAVNDFAQRLDLFT